jgi:hypothetical protein
MGTATMVEIRVIIKVETKKRGDAECWRVGYGIPFVPNRSPGLVYVNIAALL